MLHGEDAGYTLNTLRVCAYPMQLTSSEYDSWYYKKEIVFLAHCHADFILVGDLFQGSGRKAEALPFPKYDQEPALQPAQGVAAVPDGALMSDDATVSAVLYGR